MGQGNTERVQVSAKRGTTALFMEALRNLRAEKDAKVAALNERLARPEAVVSPVPEGRTR